MAIIALLKKEYTVVQTSLVGSILSNLLLVLGMCFFFGGWTRKVQHFNKTVAQTAASLLALAVASNIVPTVFATLVAENDEQGPAQDLINVAALSRGTSVILLVIYAAYLYFQLGTHSTVFAERSPKAEMRDTKPGEKKNVMASLVQTSNPVFGAIGTESRDGNGQHAMDRPPSSNTAQEEVEEEEEAQLSIYVAFGLLLGATVLIAFCAEFMVDGITVITESGVSVEFVGLILLPIVGNAAEHYTAVTVAMKDKMDLAIGVAVGSSMQVSLFLIPFLVIVGWGKGMDEMNLAFDMFQTAVLFVAVLLVNYLIADGESHWLEGALLMGLYLIIAVCSWCKSLLSPDQKWLIPMANSLIRVPRRERRLSYQTRPHLDKACQMFFDASLITAFSSSCTTYFFLRDHRDVAHIRVPERHPPSPHAPVQ